MWLLGLVVSKCNLNIKQTSIYRERKEISRKCKEIIVSFSKKFPIKMKLEKQNFRCIGTLSLKISDKKNEGMRFLVGMKPHLL